MIALMLAAGCAQTPAAVQTLTYPPDFSYIPQDRIKSSMWILAAEVRRLDELLQTPSDTSDPDVRREIQHGLQRMAAAVEQIDSPGRTTQHPALNQNLSRFAERIQRAQRGMDRTPPNIFPASAVSGSCFLCHGSGADAKSSPR